MFDVRGSPASGTTRKGAVETGKTGEQVKWKCLKWSNIGAKQQINKRSAQID